MRAKRSLLAIDPPTAIFGHTDQPVKPPPAAPAPPLIGDDGDRADLDQRVRAGHLDHLDHGRGGQRLLEILARTLWIALNCSMLRI